MAKTSVKQKRIFFCGLLIFIFAQICLFAKGIDRSVIRQLTVKADSSVFFTAQENGYTLKVPDAEPAMIMSDLPSLPPGVQLVSSKREEYLDGDGTRGTAVHLWFTFKDTGPVKMPPLILTVGNKTYYIPFEDIEVYENPALISPVTEIDFESSVKIIKSNDGLTTVKVNAGEEIIFTVGLKFFVQIISLDWKIPKDSIFQELERYDFNENMNNGREFSTSVTPLIKFKWIPLVEGTYTMPDLSIAATSYSGGRKIVKLPAYILKVAHSRTSYSLKNHSNADEVFEYAFFKIKNDEQKMKDETVLLEDCRKLAQLRSKERHSFFGGDTEKERKTLELKLGLNQKNNETRIPVIILFLGLMFIFISLFIFFILKGHVKLSLSFFCCTLFCAIICCWGGTSLVTDYGIFAGGNITPVPEPNTSSALKVDGGLRVKISEKTGEYYYIETDDVSGWVKKSLVFEIN